MLADIGLREDSAGPQSQPPRACESVVIIGGGFSGTLQAINLLRHDGPRAILVERRGAQLARGVAYSAAHPSHLLNVRAGSMSAFPDDPDHFVRWLAHEGGGTARSFVPRNTYGRYLASLLDSARRASGNRLTVVEDEAVDVTPGQSSVSVRLANGAELSANAAVLALGNLPPHPPPGLDTARLPPGCYAADPWAADIVEGLGDDDEVLLLGTGLTAIDAALLLDARGFRGRILALSRRGLCPRSHHDAPPAISPLSDRPPAELSDLVRFVRLQADMHGWRDAVDALRPMTQMMWSAAPDMTRRRFLRHLRPWWDVHRHRLAPEVAARIAALQVEGRLRFAAGKIARVDRVGGHAEIAWQPRGETCLISSRFQRVVNCTGPQGDLLRTDQPLLHNLLLRRRIRPDLLRLGLDIDAQSRVIAANGTAWDSLYAIGPMTRGGLWEIVAVPDLRRQTWSLARRLANAHWVGGEGL
ncbi:FAD/NAD(P)-binding protein [Sphingomonas sp. LaA6.9]|uniref:FAD/NAD(P)-binding protein n=1 Tax=Sphingomonas sp. LaA6.9 TaxID=2919914 RepID=UPI001F503D28|nr:FAD/NAD(P)-binding protein [Sphingomonas sp. LaA6.9]MCJ8159097.1 FAD/NAD(P)-binding protein [Sphingomonas sp. LaA6.9]